MLKAFEMTLGGATQRLAVVYDEGVRRTPIGGFDKPPFAAEYRNDDGDSSAPVLCRCRGGG